MEERIARLEKQVSWFRNYAIALTLVTLVLVIGACKSAVNAQGILRTRGLIIEDEKGRDRILIGVPIPVSRNRVRTDLGRVREVWSPRFPHKYMDWYQGYQHEMNGVLILDANGFDRVALGDPVPDPNVGKRIGPSSGLVINDQEGFERSGYGLLKVGDRNRVVLGLDHAEGSGGEGATLSLEDGGPIGLEVQDGERSIWVGTAPRANEITGGQGQFHGIALMRGKEVKYQLNVAKGQ